MSEITPQQMRELADEFENDREDRQQILAALRTAADQLELVRAYAESHYSASTVARQIVRMMKQASDD